jgi:methylenetetrahydrofolate reductase (NADPH)
MKSGSNLEKVFGEGKFAVTGEIGPPKSCDGEHVREWAKKLKGYADAFNLTDNQTAVVRLSSFGAAVILLQEGVEPVMQMVCRDRNRIAMQSDMLGASAVGVKNILCLTGDHQILGNQPQAKNVFDVDSLQQLMMFKHMRDEGKVWGGDELGKAPKLFLGAAINPFGDPYEYRIHRFMKKITAGADFIQTQVIYDWEKFERFMEEVRSHKLDEKVYIMGGLTPIKSLGAAKYMKKRVAGIAVPDWVIDRLSKASDVKAEGLRICVETIEQLKSMKGIHGVHVMAIAWEEKLPEIVENAGLLPRPQL